MTHIAVKKMSEILNEIPPVPAFVIREPERSRAVSPYAPMHADPVRLGAIMVESVSKHGTSVASEIDKTAGEVIRNAAEVAGKLKELAETIRHHCADAQQYLAAYCENANEATTTIQELAGKFSLGRQQS